MPWGVLQAFIIGQEMNKNNIKLLLDEYQVSRGIRLSCTRTFLMLLLDEICAPCKSYGIYCIVNNEYGTDKTGFGKEQIFA